MKVIKPFVFGIAVCGLMVIGLGQPGGILAESPKMDRAPVPVTVKNFALAETHKMMQGTIAYGGFGEWFHIRELTPLDMQVVVRMNRDTLYSGVVLDLTSPATFVMPDVGDRYQSALIINEGNYAKMVVYEPGEYTLTQDNIGSRYVNVIVRTLVDMEDPEDVANAHAAQDKLKIIQADKGHFEIPDWDTASLDQIRDALKVLGASIRECGGAGAYGANSDDVDPVAHLICSATAWGGWKPENAVYLNFVPRQNDGIMPYVKTIKDVPNARSAFWSISVYNADGFFQENEHGKYTLNSRKTEANPDGSVTIRFGGDPTAPNFLPVMENWNYMLRIYLPQEAYFDGSWQAPEAQPVN